MSDLHGHGSGEPPSALLGRRALGVFAVLLTVVTALGLVLLWPGGTPASDEIGERGERVRGTVTALKSVPCSTGIDEPGDAPEPPRGCVRLAVLVDEGPDRGKTVELTTGREEGVSLDRGIVLYRSPGEMELNERYQFADVQRGRSLALLGIAFVAAVVLFARRRGLLALLGLGLSVLVLTSFLVPALLEGSPPLLVGLVGASAVMILVLVLAHGPNVRTAIAMAGTGASLLLIMGLSAMFVSLSGLTGLTSDDDYYVQALFGQVDLRGLLLAGIVIGALGILDDVTVTQVSIVWELREADPSMPRRDLYAAAVRVGRDHIASTVNTLLLAYAGASLPLLVIFSTGGEGVIATLTNAVVAEEIVRTLVGSIGLVAAVPLTTALAATLAPATAPRPLTGWELEDDEEDLVEPGPQSWS